jgi:chromosome partitioning protein
MATILTVANQKGGVGKTDLAVNLSSCLAESGKKTLLIDMDPQENATHYLLGAKPKRTISDLLSHDKARLKNVVHQTEHKNLSIVPGDSRMNATRAELLSDAGMQFKLKRKLKNEKDFDYIVIDTPPSLDPITINALTASNGVVIPVQVHYLAIEGMEKLMETVNIIKKEINPKLDVYGYVLTMYDKRNRLSGKVEAMLRGKLGDKVFSSTIPVNVDLACAPDNHKPITSHAKNSIGAYAYRNLTKEFIANGY